MNFWLLLSRLPFVLSFVVTWLYFSRGTVFTIILTNQAHFTERNKYTNILNRHEMIKTNGFEELAFLVIRKDSHEIPSLFLSYRPSTLITYLYILRCLAATSFTTLSTTYYCRPQIRILEKVKQLIEESTFSLRCSFFFHSPFAKTPTVLVYPGACRTDINTQTITTTSR